MNENTNSTINKHDDGNQFVPPIPSVSLYPTDMAALYNYPISSGSGIRIGIIEVAGGYRLQDIQTYVNRIGINTTLNIIDVVIMIILMIYRIFDSMDTSRSLFRYRNYCCFMSLLRNSNLFC